MAMTRREHCRLARELIAACDGPDEAARNCRVSKGRLSDYGNPNLVPPLYMPSDVIACLEEYCGQPIYSSALARRFDPLVTNAADLKDAACHLSEEVIDLQRTVREAVARGPATPAGLDRIADEELRAEEALERVRAALRAAEAKGGQPRLKPVA